MSTSSLKYNESNAISHKQYPEGSYDMTIESKTLIPVIIFFFSLIIIKIQIYIFIFKLFILQSSTKLLNENSLTSRQNVEPNEQPEFIASTNAPMFLETSSSSDKKGT